MATDSRKDKASQAALQAVEDALALDLGDIEPDAKTPANGSDPDFDELENRLAEVANDLRRDADQQTKAPTRPARRDNRNAKRKPLRTAAASAPREPVSDMLAANDDRSAGISEFVYGMQGRPSNRIFQVAAGLTGVWLLICTVIFLRARASGAFPSDLGLTTAFSEPSFLLVVVVTFLPLLLFWAFAIMIRRAQEMREAAGNMTQAAIRLLQPESVAADSVVSVGRAIRREVAAIGDGMELALARASELEALVQNEVNSLERSYSDSEIRLRGLVEELASERTEIIRHAERLRASLSDTHSGLTDEMDVVSQRIEQTINEATRRVSDALSEQHSTITDSMSTTSGALIGAMDERARALAGDLAARSSELIASLDDRTAAIMEAFDSRSGNFASNLDQIGGSLVAQLDDRVATISADIAGRGSELLGALDARTSAVNEGLEMRMTGFIRGLDERTASLGEDLHKRSGTLLGLFDKRTGKLIGEIDEKSSMLARVIEEKRSLFTSELEGLVVATGQVIDEKARRLSEILSERAKAINTQLGAGLIDTQTTLEERTREFNQLLAERSAELNAILEQQAMPLVENLTSRGDEVARRLEAVHGTIGGEIVQMLNELRQASDALEGLLSSTGANLTSMERTIIEQAGELRQAVDKANHDVEHSSSLSRNAQQKMETTANTLMANIAHIAERFEEQGRRLQQATNLIDAAQVNLTATLDDRQEALLSLATGLATRSEEIEKTMGSFGEMLSRTMEDMTDKSRKVGSHVSAEIGSAIEEAGRRFAKAVEDMRVAAAEIRKDLDDTREQMRRGVMELPDETRETADAMRRVVADQIAALKDLSEIVTRSGKSLDVSPALPAPKRGFGGAEAVARAPQPAYQQVERAPQPVRMAFAQAEPAARIAAEPRAQPKPQTGGEQSWMSELLRRASSDEPVAPGSAGQAGAGEHDDKRPPLHAIESLNSISMDIARAIDHESFIELWDRYQRGERNVFTRRLYTLQGQRTFDEIRSKYGQDKEFRDAVDRYVSDFERLLEEVSRNDRDNVMRQTYLTSDTGKVYTMLAHAAGRFGKN